MAFDYLLKLRQGQKIRIISPDRLLQQVDLEKDLLVSVAFMGAPVVLYEQTTSGQETPVALRSDKSRFD